MIERALIYGDLLFETILASGGVPVLAHAHYERLVAAATVLKFEHHLSFDQFVTAIKQALATNNLADARVRFVLYRDTTGFYKPATLTASWYVDVFPLPEIKQSIKLGLYTDNYKPCNELSTLKTGNALLYVMAGIWASENGYDDALILNEHGCVCEATSSNIFIVKNEQVITPPVSEGCVDGVKRRFIMHRLQEQQYPVKESVVTIEQVQDADAVFLTNAITGVVKVAQFEDRMYDNSALGILFS
jgi:branched-chain amino acid aminotransferase